MRITVSVQPTTEVVTSEKPISVALVVPPRLTKSIGVLAPACEPLHATTFAVGGQVRVISG